MHSTLHCVYDVWSIGASSSNVATTARCEYYNDTLCQESKQACFETQECEQPEPEKRNHCFVLWQNNSMGKPYIKLKVSLTFILGVVCVEFIGMPIYFLNCCLILKGASYMKKKKNKIRQCMYTITLWNICVVFIPPCLS